MPGNTARPGGGGRRAVAVAVAVAARAAGAVATAGVLLTFDPLPVFGAFGLLQPFLVLAAATVVVLVGTSRVRCAIHRAAARIAAVPERGFEAGLVVVSLLLYLSVAVWVFERMPHITDSTAYQYAARVFASGRWLEPTNAMPEHTAGHFFVSDPRDPYIFTVFPPGWPLLLAPAEAAGAGFVVAPVLGAVTNLFAYRTARTLLGTEIARLTALFMLVSPFWLFMWGEFMSHPAAAMWSMVVLYALGVGRGARSLAAATLAAAALALTRPLNAAILVFPALVAVNGRPGARAKLAGLTALVGGIALGAAGIAGWNVLTTGDARRFAAEVYFDRTEGRPRCHDLGFGSDRGCIGEHGPDAVLPGYTPAVAAQVTAKRLRNVASLYLGLPPLVLLIAWGAAVHAGVWPGLVWFYATVAGYGLFYYHGLCYGPRLYFEAMPALYAAGAAGAAALWRTAAAWDARVRAAVPTLPARLAAPFSGLYAATAGGALLMIACVNLPLLVEEYHRHRDTGPEVTEDEAASGLTGVVPRVIFLPGRAVDLGSGLPFNPPGYAVRPDLPVRYVRSRPGADGLYLTLLQRLGAPADIVGFRRRPGRRYGESWGFEPVAPFRPGDALTLEGESFLDLARVQGPHPWLVGADEAGVTRLSRGAAVWFAGSGNRSEATLTFWAPAMTIECVLHVIAGPASGRWAATFDGAPWADIEGAAPAPALRSVAAARLRIGDGLHALRFVVRGRTPPSSGFALGLDRLVCRTGPP